MTAVEITMNLDFQCSYKSKNNGEKLRKTITLVACYEVVSSHKLVLLKERRSYTAASIALVNGCIA